MSVFGDWFTNFQRYASNYAGVNYIEESLDDYVAAHGIGAKMRIYNIDEARATPPNVNYRIDSFIAVKAGKRVWVAAEVVNVSQWNAWSGSGSTYVNMRNPDLQMRDYNYGVIDCVPMGLDIPEVWDGFLFGWCYSRGGNTELGVRATGPVSRYWPADSHIIISGQYTAATDSLTG